MQPEQYETHAVWNVVDSLNDLVAGDLGPWDDASRYWVRRLHAGAELADALRDIDPVLVEPPALQELQNQVQQVANMLTRYCANTDAERAYLESAAQNVQGIITAARTHFPWSMPDDASRAVKGAATRYKNSLDAEVERLIDRIDDLEKQLVAAQQAREQDEAASRERLAELGNTIDTRGTDIDALVTKLQAQIDEQRTAFEAESVQRAAASKKALQDINDADDHRIEEAEKAEEARILAANEAAEEARKEQRAQAETLVAALEGYRDQAKALVDTTSRHAVAGDYGTWSARQATAAFWWTVAAVVIGLATVGGLVVAIKSTADDSLQFTLYKTCISVVGLIVAGYAARQASEHRREERTAKRLALDLAALGPFLENVEDAEPLRQAVAKRVFAPEAVDGAVDGEHRLRIRGRSMTVADLVELLKVAQGSN